MLSLKTISDDLTDIQAEYWPPVAPFSRLDGELRDFLALSPADQRTGLAALRTAGDAHGAFIQTALATIYGYVFGYRDSPLFQSVDDASEIKILQAKVVLEREMLDHFLVPRPIPPELTTAAELLDYLETFVATNEGVLHPLFDFLADEVSHEAFRSFLRLEVIRNEVVDDEVAFLIVGLQGSMKKVMTSNLWDECGNGNLQGFHTYWLRRLLNATNDVEEIKKWRMDRAPWFSKIASNSFNMMGTRPGYAYRAYGSFLVTEAWVRPHFERILKGLRRVGLGDPEIGIYFTQHVRIDTQHTAEMLAAIRIQSPALSFEEVREIAIGAHTAAAAGRHMYDRLQHWLSPG